MTLERLHKHTPAFREIVKTNDGFSVRLEQLPHMNAVNECLQGSQFSERWLIIRGENGDIVHQGIMTLADALQRCSDKDFTQPAKGLRDRLVSFPVNEKVKNYLVKMKVLDFVSDNHYILRKGGQINLTNFTYSCDVYETPTKDEDANQLLFIFKNGISFL